MIIWQGVPNQTKGEPVGVFGFLYRNLDQYRARFFWILFASVIAGVSAFLIPAALAQFMQGELTTGRIQLLIAVVVSLYVVHLAFQWIVRWFGEALATQFANHVRGKYFRRIEQQPVEKLNQQHSGMMLQLTSAVADAMQQVIYSLFWEIAPGLASLVLFIYFTFEVSLIAGGLNVVLLVLFVGIGILLSIRMVPLSAELNVRQATLVESFVDLATNILTVKKLGLRKFAEERLQGRIKHTAEQINRVQKFHANRWLLLHTLYGIAFLGTIGLIAWQVANGTTALSLLILFVGGYSATRGLIERLSENIKSFMELRAYMRILEDTVSGGLRRRRGKNRAWRELVCKDVQFSYNGAARSIRIPEFVLHAGERVCITGSSGQGKSTFLGLVGGFHEPESGQITVDGETYNRAGQEFLDSQIATISQDTELFDLTLRENVTLGANIPDDELRRHFEEFGLGDWLARLEQGLDTRVGEKGVKLSAGQRQRVNLMRGLLLDRSLYILDEPTSHLDEETEMLIVRLLQKRLHGKTAIIVTHRPALRQLCQRSYEMRGYTLRPNA